MPAFIASCHWPFAVDPAEERHRDPRLAAHLEREREPRRDLRHVGEHRDHADAAEVAIPEVHVAFLAAGHASRPSHVVGEIAVRGDPAHEMSPQVAVQDAHPVPGPSTQAPTDMASWPQPS